MSETRSQRRMATGIVDRAPKDKTIVVKSVRLVEHPKYHRYVRRVTLYRVHDEAGEAKLGDTVEIMESRPISKTKHWRLARVIGHSTRQGSEVAS